MQNVSQSTATKAVEEVLHAAGPLRSIEVSLEEAERAIDFALSEVEAGEGEIRSWGYETMTEFHQHLASRLKQAQAALRSLQLAQQSAVASLRAVLPMAALQDEGTHVCPFRTRSSLKQADDGRQPLLEFKVEQLLGGEGLVTGIFTCFDSVHGRLGAMHLARTLLAEFSPDATATALIRKDAVVVPFSRSGAAA